ncbi:hypothetical protein P872_15045 [Rhodonellum psychrophilum GCM71 = DSM 17998]|uniref:Aryldialkylphosphatase n=2 Tax=Rhodonellum TaxID=336827 RepID=U5C3J4_9BACT|nr:MULTISPECIES: hypothetical protein [Rhodonellum]ERM84359.1 hypothetical protein P872_15045 [Rhodonellum psychrophilum GCM71 = DSM 17998]SDZ42711.1 phosphotriesterase-related protein [Rhodonellum ikkaensis]
MKHTILYIFILAIHVFSCGPNLHKRAPIHTAKGLVSSDSLGISLIHEHILVDFIGADKTGYNRWDRDTVIKKVLPYLLELKSLGVETIMECTPAYLGRDPELLKKLSELSGLNILTNTGYYGAVGGKYLPQHAYSETAKELSKRWIMEFENGIEQTGIKPAFIKISVNDTSELSEMDQKLVKAAALTHLRTGMAIVSHTGSWQTASAQIAILKAEGVDLSAFVWVHAQAEQDFGKYLEAGKSKVWISLDGVVWDLDGHLERLVFAKENDLLNQILISHDAGWYSPGEPDGGDFKEFTSIFKVLIPALKEKGFTQKELDLLLIENPRKVFALGMKKIKA